MVAGLFLTGLETTPELKSSLTAMSGQLVRPLRAVGNGRMWTIGVGSGAAASVLLSCQVPDYSTVAELSESSEWRLLNSQWSTSHGPGGLESS